LLVEAAYAEVAPYSRDLAILRSTLIMLTGGDLIGGGTGLIHAVTRADELF
jgi:hypothetical protein